MNIPGCNAPFLIGYTKPRLPWQQESARLHACCVLGDTLFLWMPPSQTGGCAFFIRSAFMAPPSCERSSSRRDCRSRGSNYSPGADGLPLLERNEEAPFSCVHAHNEGGLRDQGKIRLVAQKIVPQHRHIAQKGARRKPRLG